MDDELNLPHELSTRLAEAARNEGTTPIGWVEQHLPSVPPVGDQPHTMADVFGDSIGKFHSTGDLRASERVNELFGEHLEQKRREGRL